MIEYLRKRLFQGICVDSFMVKTFKIRRNKQQKRIIAISLPDYLLRSNLLDLSQTSNNRDTLTLNAINWALN